MTEWETAAPAVAETPDIKLFGKWSTDDVQINDISLQDYIAVKEKYAKYLPHSAGRYAAKRFRKAQCPIVERLTNSMMMHGRNNGKKLMTVRIVKHAFEIIHLLTGENPLQVLVNAIINSGPREDSTRIGRAGTVRRQAVDVSPLRRVNQVGLGGCACGRVDTVTRSGWSSAQDRKPFSCLHILPGASFPPGNLPGILPCMGQIQALGPLLDHV
ncbi:40S ribosomal protein S5 isoform X1 [Carlito syrichta]|uniref:Small ribosomal subunit protein uS7 n=1 Tax=Carlito syrichta TaxID=1868482 RepID=A0A3Q0EF22_CARSF|nr:40S ribosomal protein S5 isoform X1 [Carlito syrichta]